MSISNLSSQYISQSFQSLTQYSGSGKIYDGLGAQITSLDISTTSAATASYLNNLTQNLSITGSLSVSGSQTFRGNKTISGSVFITGSKTIIGANSVTGAMDISGTLSMTGPFVQNSATLVSPLISGSIEYDGSTFYRTADSSGRSLNANHHLFYLPTAITHSVAISTAENVFSGSLHAFTMQPNAMYEVLYTVFYQKITTAGQMSFNVVSSNSWQNANLQYDRTGLAGTGNSFNAGVSAAALAPISQTIINSTGNNVGFNTPTNDTLNSYQRVNIKGLIWNNALSPSSLRLQFTYSALGLIIWPGSYYTIKKLPVSSVGVFTA